MNLIYFRETNNNSTTVLVVTYYYYDDSVKGNPVWLEVSIESGMYYQTGTFYNPITRQEQNTPYEKPPENNPEPSPNDQNKDVEKDKSKTDKTKTGFFNGLFSKTSIAETALGIPKNAFWIGLIVLLAIIGLIIRTYQKNALKVNELTEAYANSI